MHAHRHTHTLKVSLATNIRLHTHLRGFRLAIEVLSALCQSVKALWGMDASTNALREEATLAILGTYCQNIEILQTNNSSDETASLSLNRIDEGLAVLSALAMPL